MLELYHFWDSPCSMKARLTLAEKGLDWTSHHVMLPRFDHFDPAYRALNPHSLVPTLVHDGKFVIQSSVIAEYIDDAFPDPPLKPIDPFQRAKMHEWMAEEEEFLFRLIVVMTFNTMMKLRAIAYGPEMLEKLAARHPDKARARNYLERVTAPADLEAVAQAETKLNWHMDRLDHQLAESGGPWICGELFSLADVCVAPIIDRLEYLDKSYIWEDRSALGDWVGRIKARSSYQQSIPPFENRMWGPKKPVPEHRVDPDEAGDTFPV